MIDEILAAKVQFARRNPDKVPRIMVNPALFKELITRTDERGVYIVYIDPFKRENWALLGMKVVEDIDVERWEIF